MIEDDDFAVEPVRGLPERLPPGERMIWQGAPDWRVLARRAFNCRPVAWYFVLLALWQGAAAALAGGGVAEALAAGSWMLALGLIVVGVLALIAWATARATVYTITNKRVVLRVGVALRVTLNLPYRCIGAADLLVHGGGSGDIALRLTGDTKLAYLMLWPHVRPWAIRRPQPALRAIPDAATAAALLAEAMRAAEAERLAAEGLAAEDLVVARDPVSIAAE